MAPTIYPRSESGLVHAPGTGMFGGLGEIDAVTIHHSAGPRAPTKARAQELHRAYQAQHIRQGWGDIGYHFGMDDAGRFYRLRSTSFKGAHVGGSNTGNVGIMVHGNYEHDELTVAQRESIEWLFEGGFYALFGEPERSIFLARGHREWPGHTSNACPGRNLFRHWSWRRSVSFHEDTD
jgi:hypothetical protein